MTEQIIDPHKISFIIDKLSKAQENSIKRMCGAAKPSLKQFTTMANHSLNWMQPPSGSVQVWKKDGKFFPDPFYCDLFRAIVVKEIDFSDRHWNAKTQAKLLKKINKFIPQKSSKPPRLESDDRNYDQHQWVASLGDRNSYIGLFSSRHRNKNTRQWFNKWFIVCNAGVDAQTYEDFEEYLCKCEEKGKTFAQVFENDKKVARLRVLCKRNRKRLIKQFGDLLDIRLQSRKDAHATDPNEAPELAPVDLETEYNFIHKMKNFYIFYNQCTNTELVKGGLILQRSPQLGPIVLCGPSTSTTSKNFFKGGTWTNNLYNAFPVNTGILPPHSEEVAAPPPKTFPNTFICEENEGVVDYLSAPFRSRTKKWKEIETQLGFREEHWGEPIELQPVIVKYSTK